MKSTSNKGTTDTQKKINQAVKKALKDQKESFVYSVEFVRKWDYENNKVKNEVLDDVLSDINPTYDEDKRHAWNQTLLYLFQGNDQA